MFNTRKVKELTKELQDLKWEFINHERNFDLVRSEFYKLRLELDLKDEIVRILEIKNPSVYFRGGNRKVKLNSPPFISDDYVRIVIEDNGKSEIVSCKFVVNLGDDKEN